MVKSDLFSEAKKQYSANTGTKPLHYYKRYDEFINNNCIETTNIVEIGTFQGESTRILATTFPNSRILTIDISNEPRDFSNFTNIFFANIDQSNAIILGQEISTMFPDGVDLVIDDASHLGSLSYATFKAVFPFLKSGGAYFIEDWGTGYWSEWPDGADFESSTFLNRDVQQKEFLSHSAGMVGFVKSLVDHTSYSDIKSSNFQDKISNYRIKVLEFGPGIAMAVKE